jgi:hypothetical protein
MPLRDHFRPPLELKHSWDELHGGWPATAVQRLFSVLPEWYVAAPGVRLGTAFEMDVSDYKEDAPEELPGVPDMGNSNGGGVAVATQIIPAPTLTVETDLPDQDEYEVRIYDTRHGRTLVAAVEIVSPANKDRPESRRAFVAKCLALLQKGVCVSIVDVVTVRQFNLYADALEQIGAADPALKAGPPYLYATSFRSRKRPRGRSVLDTWFYPLVLGQPLPPLPIWLTTDLHVSLDLEASYEDACRVLRIA